MSKEAAVLSVGFKVNLLAPAEGKDFRAVGRVVRAGRTLTGCNGDIKTVAGDEGKLIAIMQTTMITMLDSPGISD